MADIGIEIWALAHKNNIPVETLFNSESFIFIFNLTFLAVLDGSILRHYKKMYFQC